MNPKKIASLLVLSGVIGFLGGCASEPNSTLVSAPPPNSPTGTVGQTQVIVTQPQQQQQVITTTNAPTGATSYIVVQSPPAAPPPVAMPARPSNQHVWIDGYWVWQNSRYEWMAGHWATPPSPGAEWVAPRWVPENNFYRFFDGYWN